MLKTKSAFGNMAPETHKPQKCCCTMAKFPSWKSDLSLSFFSSLSFFFSSCFFFLALCIFSFIRFPLLFEPKYLKGIHLNPSAIQTLQTYRGFLRNYTHIYWSTMHTFIALLCQGICFVISRLLSFLSGLEKLILLSPLNHHSHLFTLVNIPPY